MENIRTINFLTFLVGGTLLVLPFFVFGYDDKTTHPALTQEIVKMFNQEFQSLKFNDEEKEIIIQGSIKEDEKTRWMQHFYDPVYNRGLTMVGQEWMSSKEWAENTLAQAGFLDSALAGTLTSYFSGEDDYSWGRAIYEYTWGDRKRGLEALGHTLHLIEDKAVPDHTRNDDHFPYFNALLHEKSPYEYWADQWIISNINVVDELQKEQKAPKNCGTLNSCFDSMALYSNNNFFSKDTILKEYTLPKILEERSEFLSDGQSYNFGYSQDNFGDQVRLVKIKRSTAWSDQEYSLVDNDKLILTDYWTHLSKQAVLHGAGVIKLFFDEVEKEKQTKVLYYKNRSWLKKQIDKLKDFTFGLAGVIYGVSVTESDLAGTEPVAAPSPAPLPQQPPQPLPSTFPVPAVVSNAIEPEPAPPPIQTEIISLQLTSAQTPLAPPSSNTSYDLPIAGAGGPPPTQAPQPAPQPPTPQEETASSTPEEIQSEPPPSADITPPDISLAIVECNQSLAVDGCLLATTTLHLLWSSNAEDLSYFIVECEEAGTKCQNFNISSDPNISSTTATSTIYIAESSPSTDSGTIIYTFTARARDKNGNESTPATQTVATAARPIVINEVAWAGTSASRSEDEWIELKNVTGKDINLSGWVLYSETDKTPYIPLAGTIPANGFYLLERTDDTAISDIAADQIYTGALNNSPNAEILILSHASTTMDKTPLCSRSYWCGGEAGPDYYWTMERYDPFAAGESDSNWGSWTGILQSGKNRDALPIKGTPKARNSINYFVSRTGTSVAVSKTLRKTQSPYIIPSSALYILEDATLTLEPGIIIKFMNGGSMEVQGKISAEGTAEEPIVFTAFTDDSYGGDTNQDASETLPEPGYWGVIKILADGSVLDHMIIRYGGIDDALGSIWANLKGENAEITLKNSIIEKSKNYGAWLKNTTGVIESNIFRENNRNDPGKTAGAGMVISGGSPSVRNNQFTQNNVGLFLDTGARPQVSGNNFSENINYAVQSIGAYPILSDNAADLNGINGINIQSTLTQDYMLVPDLTYIIQNTTYAVPADKTLTILPGTVIKLQGLGSMSVLGRLLADGAPDNKIVFTSLNDDEYGGDTNGTTTQPQDGDWTNISFGAGSDESSLSHVIVRYGGTTWGPSPEKGALRIAYASVAVDAAVIEKSYFVGVWLENSASTTISNSLIQDHREPNIPTPNELSYGIFLVNSSPTIQNTTFRNNKVHIGTDGVSDYVDGGGNVFE